MTELLYGDVFDFPVVKLICSHEIYSNPTIAVGLDTIFSSNRVKKNQLSWSTCPISGSLNDIQNIPNISPLLSWISASILKNRTSFGNPDARTVTFTRGWTNRMFKGCANQCHTHAAPADGVAVFYHSVPDTDSSNLVLIKNGQDETPINMYPEEDCYYLEVKTGDLVIHHRSIPHAVSRHNNDEPRTCIVLNFALS